MKNLFRTVTEKEAALAGMTHEGTIYGIPSWLKVTQNYVSGVPKAYVLRHLVEFLDSAFTVLVGLWPFAEDIEMPHSVKRRINYHSENASIST